MRSTKKLKTDVLIIGAGAAGMFAAIQAARAGARVTVLERGPRVGRKLAITGKGRCNVTNEATEQEVLKNIPRNGRFLNSAMYAMSPYKVMDFFEECGVPLKVERGKRVFPVSDKAGDIVGALKTQMHRAGVIVETARAKKLLLQDGAVCGVETEDGHKWEANRVIVATGGLSYPLTGSTGDGYDMARQVGHTIVEPVGSLVPLEEDGGLCRQMQGLSLRNVAVRLVDEKKGKAVYEDFGEMLFTHFGVSGPTILSASAHMKQDTCYRIEIDLKPALDEQALDARILRDFSMYQNRTILNALTDLYPSALIPVMVQVCGIDPDTKVNSLTKQQRRAILENTKRFTVKIAGKRPVAEAIVTSGGVSTKEINPRTMESKLCPGLYFAGEIIDCDGYTGGFNLQIAWATGALAGRAAAAEEETQ